MDRVRQLIDLNVEEAQFSRAKFDENMRDGCTSDLLLLCAQQWLGCAVSAAMLYWGRGEIAMARAAFDDCVSAHEAAEGVRARAGGDRPRLPNACWAVVAAYLLGRAPASTRPLMSDAPVDVSVGYQPWFDDFFADACACGTPIDTRAYEASKALWVRRKFASARVHRWDFYAAALTGAWAGQPAKMLAEHERVYRMQRKIALADIVTGDGEYNAYVPDLMFAAILKRTGWRGACRHAWVGAA